MPYLPTPESISGFDKLGITAVLIFVILTGLVVIVWAVKQIRSIAREFLAFITEITRTMTELRDAHAGQQDTQSSLHERLDNLLSCTRSGCPVFEMRKKQQRDAARAAAGEPVSSAPSHHPHPA